MNHAESDEFRVFQSWDQAKHPGLLAPLQLGLKAHKAVMVSREVVLPKLQNRIRLPSGSRVDEPDRFHRSESQSGRSTMRHHFDGQAPLEELLLVEIVNCC